MTIGDGPDQLKIKALAAKSRFRDDIIFTGFCDKPQDIIQAFDVGVVPSRREAFGLSALELMACGVPTATSKLPAFGEVAGGCDCTISFTNTPEQIAKAIDQLRENPQRIASLKTNALKRANAFNLTTYHKKLNTLYKKTTQPPNP